MVRELRKEQTMPAERRVRGGEPVLWGCEHGCQCRFLWEGGDTGNVLVSDGVLSITVAESKR